MVNVRWRLSSLRLSILFRFSRLPLENRGEQTRAVRGLRQSGGFFHDLVDSPFLPFYFFLHQLFPPFSCSSCSHGIVQSRTSLSHRYLMARAKSPITQLPWCMYRTYVYMHTYVRWRSRVDISRECEGLSNLHASIFTCTSFFLLLLSSRYTCLTLNYNLRVYGMTNLNSLIVYYYFSVLLSSRLLLFLSVVSQISIGSSHNVQRVF